MISVRPGYATPRSVCKRECTCLCLNRALVYCKDQLLLTVPLSHLPLSDQSCCFAHHAATGCTYQPSHVVYDSPSTLPRACQSCQTSSVPASSESSFIQHQNMAMTECLHLFRGGDWHSNCIQQQEGLLCLQHAVLPSADT